ncbi:MAG: hypothetical protein DRI90_03705 [Deltaproteobacteria bacterium]|nr:MAG: hypothetical protein DRI90_03705 [Deltaproteobacteria bacterium]
MPIWTSHTVLRADGDGAREQLRSVTIAEVDAHFQPVVGSERTYEVDTLLIAVGLNSCDELLVKSQELGLKVYGAGDTAEIAEASAAIFSGRIVGRQIARDLGAVVTIPEDWSTLAAVLRSRPGKVQPLTVAELPLSVHPVIRCVQEIPCDPCEASCPEGLITIGDSIMNLPHYDGVCLGCGECVSVCPGLAINLVFNDYDPSGEHSLLMLPFECSVDTVPPGAEIDTVDMDGEPVGKGRVIALRERPEQDRRVLLLVEVPAADKLKVAGFAIRGPSVPIVTAESELDDDPIVCRCERVPKSAIVEQIRGGVRDLNQLKALARAGMGGCGGKTCTELVRRIFREEGVDLGEVTAGTTRPLVAETPLGAFVRGQEDDRGE